MNRDTRQPSGNEPVHVVLDNVSKFPILWFSKDNQQKGLLEAGKILSTTNLQEQDYFQSTNKVDLGTVTLLRLAKDVSGWSHVGPLTIATPPAGSTVRLKLGTPIQYRDDQRYSQLAQLKSFTGGTSTVDIVNYTNVPLRFQDGLDSPMQQFIIEPGKYFRYKGRYHWGVVYGTYITNVDGIFETVQINSPITHLLYGVL